MKKASRRRYSGDKKGVLYTPKPSRISGKELEIKRSRPGRDAARPPFSAARTGGKSARRAGFSAARLGSSGGSSPTAARKRAMQSGGFLDGGIKKIALACAVIAGISAFAIPTAFAKPETAIVLNDGGRQVPVETSAQTVGEFLADNGVEIGDDDLLELDPSAPITEGMEILIWRGKPVNIRTGPHEIKTVSMVAGTVGDALALAGIEPAPQDEVYPGLDSPIRADMRIDHIIVETATDVQQHEIPFKEIEKEDSKLAKGKAEVRQDGETGILEITKEQLFKNGILISEDEISEEVLKEPVDQITAIGTYVKPKTPTQEDARYVLKMRVTAYCSKCNSGSRTATGAYPKRGTVAAKTSELPFGTRLYIAGYGYGRVEDTGGFPTGTIDVYLGDRDVCNCGSEWSTGTYTVYVL